MAVFAPANVGIIGLDNIAAEGTNAESFGADPNASAALNTVAIQAALNKTGLVTLSVPGTYLISNTLIISSATYFMVGPNVTIKLASGTNKCMLLPAAWQNYLTPTTVTLTWSAGATMSVAWTDHGLTTRDYVYIAGAGQREYNNVFRLLTVTDANNFTVELFSLPTTTPTGTTTALACTRDFTVDGGVWDYDRTNNASVSDFNADCFGIFAAANATIRNCTFINFHRGVTSGAISQVTFDRCSYVGDLAVAQEGHKTYGPANWVTIRNGTFRSTDDGSSVQTKETAVSQWTGIPFGDIYHLTYENCDAQSSGSVAAGAFPLYLSDNEIAEDIRYINCRGYSSNGSGFVIKYGNTYTTGKCTSVAYEHCEGSTNTPALQFPFSIAAAVDVVDINNLSVVPGNLTNNCVKINTNAIIKALTVRNLRFVNSTWPSSSAFFVSQVATCENVKFENCFVGGNASFNLYSCSATAAGALYSVTFDNVNLTTASRLCQITSAVTQKHSVTLRNCYLKSVTSAVDLQSSAISRVHLYGNYFDTITNLIRPNTTATLVAQVFGSGNTLNAVTNVMGAANSATCEWYTFDVPIDVGATGFVKTTTGQYAFNTSAGGARGTLVANRLVTCNGTNWIQVDTPANTF